MSNVTLLEAGAVVGGFEVEELIGAGGMATVYRARQIKLGRPVALKVLARGFGDDDVFRERFRREGEHAASLEHPNIVPVYDADEDDGMLYLAMRLVDGESLADLLGRKGITADRTIEILRPIAGAIDYAHAAGLIHRDVKPSNILITAQGHPYLTDFGVAKSSAGAGLTVTGNFVGSFHYASPEQFRGEGLSGASDVYALTAVLYHCLSGDVPYPVESEAGVMHAHLNYPPPTLPRLDGSQGGLDAVLARGMAKEAGARYERAADLIDDAARCVAQMTAERRQAVPAFPMGGRAEIDVSDPSPRALTGTEIVDRVVLDSATAADRRREPAPEEPAEKKRRRLPRPSLPDVRASRRALLPVAIVAGIAVVTILVVLLTGGGGAGSYAPVTKVDRRGPVEVSYAAPLTSSPAGKAGRLAGVAFRSPVLLRGPHQALAAGMLAGAAAVPGGVPPAFAAAVAKPSRRPIRLGSVDGVLYEGRGRKGGAALALYVVPTVGGDIGVLCSTTAGASAGACSKAARSLRAHGVRTVPPGADPALARRLAAVLGAVRAARAGSTDLLVSSPSARAQGARRIAAADAGAANKLAAASVEPRDRDAVAAVVMALRREARALGRLGAAAEARAYGAYASAAEENRAAGRRLFAATNALRAIGFTSFPRLTAVDVAALHRPAPTPEPEPVAAESSSSSAPVSESEAAPTPEATYESAPVESAPAPTPAPAPPSHAIVSAPK
jgi:serine/threonine protein kinase